MVAVVILFMISQNIIEQSLKQKKEKEGGVPTTVVVIQERCKVLMHDKGLCLCKFYFSG